MLPSQDVAGETAAAPSQTPDAIDDRPGCEPFLLGGLFLLALLVRLPGLDGDLWLDEVATLVDFVRLPLLEQVTTYTSANNHVFYSILARLSILVFGESAWAVRLPALLFGALTVPALYVLAGRFVSRRESLAAAVVLGVAYQHAYFSQNARGYTGLLLLTVISTWLLSRALREDRRILWALYAVTTAVNIYLLLSALFVCVGQFVGALATSVLPAARDLGRLRFRRLMLWMSIAAVLTLAIYSPLLFSMFETFVVSSKNVGWRPSLEFLHVIIRDLAPNRIVLIGALVGAPVALAGLVSLLRKAPLLGFAFALPPAIEFVVALSIGAGTYPRRFLLLLPFLVLVAVRGAALVADAAGGFFGRKRLSNTLFAALVLAGCVTASAGLPRLYHLPKQDYRGALAYVEARRAPGDVVAAAYLAQLGVQFYDPEAVSAREVGDLQALLAGDRRIWLIGTFPGDMRVRAPELEQLIDDRFDELARLPGLVGDGEMIIWLQRQP